MSPQIRLFIVVPCLNEAEALETHIRKVRRFLPQNHEVVVADNGSTAG